MSDRWTPNDDGLVVVRDRPLHIMLAIDSAYPGTVGKCSGIVRGLESFAREIHRRESCRVVLFDHVLLTRRTSARRIMLFCPRRR